MAFLLEQTRVRVLRRSHAVAATELPRPTLPPFSGLAHLRPLRSVPAAVSAVALVAAVLAGLSLHRSAPQTATGVRAPSLIAAGGPLTGLSLPAGTTIAPADATTTQLTALLAADLWQAATQVYQAKLLGQTAAPAPTATPAPTGPSVAQLLQAQLRVTQAQLAYQALTQIATQEQLSAARQAVAAAQAQVLAAQQAVQAAHAATPTATPVPTQPPPTDAELQQAQADVDGALAAFQRVEHPYTSDQIAAAQTDLATAKRALAAAQAVAAAPAATPAPLASATPVASATAVATAQATSATPADPAGQATAAAPGVMPAPLATVPILQTASNSGAAQSAFYPGPGADRAAAGGANGTAPTAPVATAPAASATPAATPSATPMATSPAASPQAAPPGADLQALQQQVNVAQANLDRMTAPPDPVALQQAADKVAAAQGRLSDLKAARAAADAATPAPAPSPSATPADGVANAPTPDQQLAQAQAQYTAAQAQLQTLSQPPDPAAIKSAQDELTAAQQAWQALLAQADSGVVAQVNADPQNALLRLAATGVPANSADPVPFAWPARGPISSLFGPSHPLGIDIAQGPGLPVTAAASGVVTFSGGDPCCSYGYYVDITHAGGYLTRYGHLLLPSYLKPGDQVRQGQVIGLSGATGLATGPHLHFEIRLNGVPLDPLKLLAGALPHPLAP